MISIDQMNVALALFEGLTVIDERSSKPAPAAAESWETSADGLVWTFHLRTGLQWSDGAPLTAEDFAWSLRRALTPALGSEYAYVLHPIRNASVFNSGRDAGAPPPCIRATDPTTLVIELERPAPLLPAVLALPVGFPIPRQSLARAAAAGDERRWTRPEFIVGNGPFVLKSWSPNSELVAVRNPRFHEPARLSAIVFHPFDQAGAQEAAFRSGRLHLTSDLPATRVDYYRKEKSHLLRVEPMLETNFLRFNTSRPPFSDQRVRRAFALAIDRQQLVKIAGGGQTPAALLCPAGLQGGMPTQGCGYEPTLARRLLAAAGFSHGDKFPLVRAITFASDLNHKILEELQQQWQVNLGVTVDLAPKEKNVWITEERQLDYDISLARWVADYADPMAFLELFLSGAGNNATGWADSEYDRLIHEGATESDPLRRVGIFSHAEERLLAALPIAPLFHGTQTYLADPAVRGWETAVLGFRRYQHVWLESP
jgi:oligopeptide transport system substrate-binding protein